MNWDHGVGNWTQIEGKIKERWGKLTDDDLERIAGERDQLIGRLQELYGLTEVHAEAELRDWERHQEPIDHTGLAARG
jgi:uncharacterized protein YjbJ (UPF0337 family)